MASFYDRVKMSVASAPGTGNVTLGAAVAGYRSFDGAAVPDQGTVSYVIEDGASWELGHGTYTKSGTVLARTTVIASSNAGAAINADASATVYLTLLAEDLSTLGTSSAGSTTSSTTAPVVVVQSVVAPNSSSVTFAAAPTVGNLLVVMVMDTGWGQTPSGFTEIGYDSGKNYGVGFFYKVADGSETTISAGIHPPYTMAAWELSGATSSNIARASELSTSTGVSLTSVTNGSMVLGMAATMGTATAAPTVPASATLDGSNANGNYTAATFSATTSPGANTFTATFPSGATDDYTMGVTVSAAKPPAASTSSSTSSGSAPTTLASYTVAALPSGTTAQAAFATNGRKVGEAAGAGTGVMVVYSNGAWRRVSDDTAVAA